MYGQTLEGSMSRQLCKVSEIGENGKEVMLRGESGAVYLMLFKHEGQIRAFLNVCPHQGRPLNLAPDRFYFTPGGLLMCPHHGASFQLSNGACVEGPCKGSALRSIEIDIVEDVVWLLADHAEPTPES